MLPTFEHRARLKINGDFTICNTEDDGCTVETCLVNYVYVKKVALFMRLSILLLLTRPFESVLRKN